MKSKRSRISGFLLTPHSLFLTIVFLTACTRPSLYQQESYVFGTRVEVLIYGEEAGRARESAGLVLREFDRLHRMLHAWQSSELTALTDAIARGEAKIGVSPELAAILRDASEIAQRSDHLFNPAIGQLVTLWGFHSEEFKPALPDEAAVSSLLKAQPRLSDLSIEGGQVTSRNRAVALDLGGYAKGYALDRAADLLREKGIRNALINIGGNVLALGTKDGKPWRVGIQHPREAAPLATLELRDGEAIGTSGDYQRFFEVAGKRYCHVIDPRSGHPGVGTQAITVLVEPRPGAGALSDAASKPLFLAGAGRWTEYARRLSIAAALRVDDQGTIYVTEPMRERIKMTDASTKPVVAQ